MGVATASGSMRSLRTLSCGQNGDSSAGPLAKAEAGGAAGAGGCGESPGAGALGTAKRHPWWALSGLRVSHRPCPGGSLGRAARAHLWGGARGGRGPSGGLSGRACAVARDLDVYGPYAPRDWTPATVKSACSSLQDLRDSARGPGGAPRSARCGSKGGRWAG